MFPSDLTVDTLAAALHGLGARHTAIAGNLANAETPGYRRVDVRFESALADAVDAEREARAPRGRASWRAGGGDGAAVADLAPALASGAGTAMRVDGGSVDPDDEMARLAANQLAHQTVAALLDKKLTQFRAAITGAP